MTNNPLYQIAEFPEFDKILPEHGVPAVRALMTEAAEKVAEIESSCTPTWNGRIVSVQKATEQVWRAWGLIEHLVSVANCQDWRTVEETLQPEVVSFAVRVSQSRPLYDALVAIRDSSEFTSLDIGRQRVVESAIRSARNSGVGLNGAEKEEFNAILNELSSLSMKFSNNVIDATKAFSLILRDKRDVAGLPPTLLDACAQSAREAGETQATAEDGPWRVTLEHAVYAPFMQYGERRDIRESLFRASIARASQGDIDNTPLVEKILSQRRRMAQLLGYANYAELSLSSKMADKVDAVYAMIDIIGDIAISKARQDLDELEKFAKAHGFSDVALKSWDIAYWSRLQVENLFGFSPESLRPFFQLEKVLDGLFSLARKLTGVKIVSADGTAPVWHPDVRFFKVMDEADQTIAWFYLDPYSRPETKRGGAWMNEFQTREVLPDGTVKLPIALMVCNQAVPSGDKPSCMTPSEISTLFHEFGHAMQHMLTRVDIPEASGINNIEWDAVEVASQFMENWCSRPEILRGLSCHVSTQAKLDEEMLRRIHESETHHEAIQTVRQLRFALVDMDLHAKFPSEEMKTVIEVEKASANRFSLLPPLPEDRFLCSFTHIFSGGYSAGYFSYMWADVLAADVFGLFEEAGLENDEAVQRIGRRYAQTLLGEGGARHPMEVFKSFRGREPDVTALLRHKGLIDRNASVAKPSVEKLA